MCTFPTFGSQIMAKRAVPGKYFQFPGIVYKGVLKQ